MPLQHVNGVSAAIEGVGRKVSGAFPSKPIDKTPVEPCRDMLCLFARSVGHALYEQGRNLGPEWEGLPVNSALSMGIHESQSLFWERMVRQQAVCILWGGVVHVD